MNWIESLFLGVLQGLSEFLPVSSSGHLTLAQVFLHIQDFRIEIDLLLHFSTLLVTIYFFRKDLWRIARAILPMGSPMDTPEKTQSSRKEFWLVALATLVTGTLGLLLEDHIEAAFDSPIWVGLNLIVTGSFLFGTRFLSFGKPENQSHSVETWHAIIIGLAQTMALLPGISRSGATIAAALYLGWGRRDAGRFAFLISIPAIAGALVLKHQDLARLFQLGWLEALVSFTAAAVSGYLALTWLLGWIAKGKLHRFAYYCWAAGALTLIFLLL